jgi:hypothetical protein
MNENNLIWIKIKQILFELCQRNYRKICEIEGLVSGVHSQRIRVSGIITIPPQEFK